MIRTHTWKKRVSECSIEEMSPYRIDIDDVGLEFENSTLKEKTIGNQQWEI